jgi:hypothetical protein
MEFIKQVIKSLLSVYVGSVIGGGLLGIGIYLTPQTDLLALMPSVSAALIFGAGMATYITFPIFFFAFIFSVWNRTVNLYLLAMLSGIFTLLFFLLPSSSSIGKVSNISVLVWFIIAVLLNILFFRRDLLQKFLSRSVKK